MGPVGDRPPPLGLTFCYYGRQHSFSAAAGQSVPANVVGCPGAGCQYTRRVSLTLCRKLKRSRSGGTAAIVQVTSQPTPLPPGFDPPIVALLSLPGPIARKGRAQRRKHLRLSQSKVLGRDGQRLRPITEAQDCDPDQPENRIGGEPGCSLIRLRKRQCPKWWRPRGPERTAHVCERSGVGACAAPSPSLPRASGGLWS